MEQATRNKLRNFVTQCRKLLEESIGQQLQGTFGIYAGKKGSVQIEEEARMSHLSEEDQQYRRDLLDHFEHIKARGFKAKDALDQLIREVAFTHLNRLCAYKMMEARDVYVGGQKFRESVSRGTNSNGFKFYLADHPDDERLFNTGNQETAYRHFLDWLGGTLSEEIGVLFSPSDPANRLHPRQKTLDQLLVLLNDDELAGIWEQDETIGWVYQYFTPTELRVESRKKNAAPPNSYELAFRNQFFTPRYVVSFLTDNTLGRIWYEMRKGDTKLKDQCQFMVRRPSERFLSEAEPITASNDECTEGVPHRQKKDPREIRVLDPACGSGHFLLYCFDLFLTIYDEAYDDSELGVALREEFPQKEDFRKAVPGLILNHNLHGIDIDLRATQIAALALWLRCQRDYQDIKLKKDRPAITRSNFVCAEPMPGEEALLSGFLDGLKTNRLEVLIRRVMRVPEDKPVRATEAMAESLAELVRLVWDKMQLAGNAGSLLKIDAELQEAVRHGQQEWEEKQPLFRITEYSLTEQPTDKYMRVVAGEGVSFWERAEHLVLEALTDYVSNDSGLLRRLFVNDAVQGLSFVDLCRQRYDVVLMNPPFGEASRPSKKYIESEYPRTKNDVYATFVERGLELLEPGGMLGAITSRTGFFLSTFRKWREELLLSHAKPTVFADLGFGVLDALVETAAYCLRREATGKATFIRLLASDDKQSVLHETVKGLGQGIHSKDVYDVDPDSMREVPGSPFAYWTGDRVRELFRELPAFEGDGRAARQGLATAEDFRFVRLWWEVDPSSSVVGSVGDAPDVYLEQTFQGKPWVPFAKGGEYAAYHLGIHLLVDWARDGEDIRTLKHAQTGRLASRPQNTSFYFKHGLTWARRSTSGFGLRVLPAGTIFADKGPIAVTPNGLELPTLGTLFSQSYQRLIEVSLAAGEETQSGTASRSYEVGLIQKLPWPEYSKEIVEKLCEHLVKLIDCVRQQDVADETERLFCRPVFRPAMTLKHSIGDWQRNFESDVARRLEDAAAVETIVHETLRLPSPDKEPLTTGDARTLCNLPKRELDSSFDDIYCRDLHKTIREQLDEGGGNRQIAVKSYYLSRRLEVLAQALEIHPQQIAKVAAERQLLPEGMLDDTAKQLISYSVGCVFGRWDIRYATEEQAAPELPDPFAPLTPCSPGMLQGPDGLPLHESPSDYPLSVDWDGILVDDAANTDDIVRRVQHVLELIWPKQPQSIESEACEILGVKKLRDYFRKPASGGFWSHHVSRYSKSRRKAPIYWLLQSSKKNYALWLYYHRLDKDMLFKALLNYVEPKIQREENRLAELRSQKTEGDSSTGAKKLDREIEKQEDLIAEVRNFEEKLRKVADIHLVPDLNDGVVLNIAPLHELVPWKEAKNYWDELLEGNYEWSSIGKQLREKGLVKG